MFSLIDSLIAKPKKYEQLFISTHNLEFLKFLKRLHVPDDNQGGHEHFMIISKKDGSELEVMPNYLKRYITELNYLFDEIYICHDPANASKDHHHFYGFGNNLRKFLEVFLFFKYPSASYSNEKKMELFFGDDLTMQPLINRLANELSHLAEYVDRSVKPIDYAEIAKAASYVMQKIRSNDREQFKCFLESIGNKPDPFDA